MDESKNRRRGGIFVVLTLLLLLLMMFYFGLSELFVRRAKAVTCFSESIQGLSVGSEVKFRGVRVGEVTGISILSKEKLIKVDMAIEVEHFKGIDDSSNAVFGNSCLKRWNMGCAAVWNFTVSPG